MAAAFKYWAFISYSHQDRAWGDWLHKTLETYRVPRRLVGRPSRDGAIPSRLFPVFRDRDELPSSADLGGVLNEALAASRHQIVICSPRSANSRWVNEEVRHFKSLGREDRVLCLIVDGEPNVGDARECFAPALRFRVSSAGEITSTSAEPIAADAREHADGKAGAKLKLLAGLLGVGFDELAQRERQRRFWQRVQAVVAALAFAGVIAGISQWFLHQRAAREREIRIEKIVESGRQELLDGHQARAAVFLNEAYRMGYDTVPLRFMLGQAMKPVEALTAVRVHHGGEDAFGAAFSADQSRFVIDTVNNEAGVQHATAKVYDAATGKELARLPGAPVLPLITQFFANDSRLLIAGYPDYYKAGKPYTAIWDLDRPDAVLRLDGISGIAGAPISADGSQALIATASGLERRSTRDGRLLGTFASARAVASATYSPDGKSIAIADASGTIEILSASDGRRQKTIVAGDGQTIAALVYAPHGGSLLALSDAGDVRIWDDAGALRVALAADPNLVTGLQFSGDGRRLLTIGTEGYRVWSVARGSLLFFVQDAMSPYAAASLSPDGDTLITANSQSRVSEAWDVLSKRKLYSLDLYMSGVSTAAFDPSGRRLLLASHDGYADLWRMPVQPAWKYQSFETYPYTAHFDGDGKRLLIAGGIPSRDTAMILDLDSGRIERRFPGHRGMVREARFNRAGDALVTAGEDGRALLWDPEHEKPIADLDANPHGLESALFSPDGERLLTLTKVTLQGNRDAAGLWDARDGKLVARLEHQGLVRSAQFDPSSAVIATAGEDALVKLWDARDGRLLRTLSGHKARAMSAEFNADGSRLVSASQDNSVRVWNPHTGEALATLDDAALGLPQSAVFSPDGETVAIPTQAGNVWLWHPSGGAPRVLKGHRQQVDGVVFSRDGELLFSYGWDGTTRVWATSNGAELAIVSPHEMPVSALDVDDAQKRLLSTGWGEVAIWDIAREARSPAALSAVLGCKQPWVLDESQLTLRLAGTGGCTNEKGGSARALPPGSTASD